MAINPTETAFYVGPVEVTLDDVAKAVAVQEGNGEAMDDPVQAQRILQDTKDILDRAFRYAQDRRK